MAGSTTAKGIRVTVLDLETGETEIREVADDYVLICVGTAHLDSVQAHSNGTTQLVIKGAKR